MEVDICIIGAGPAGCISAIRLREFGYSVCLIEALAFPRRHVGICLSDETYHLIDYLGVRKEVDKARFFKRKKTLVKWGAKEPRIVAQPGLHVDRGIFDHILLNKARALGAYVIQPAKVKRVKNVDDGWVIKYDHVQGQAELLSKYIVDASGKANILQGKRKRLSPALTALHGKWSLKRSPHYDGFIESGKDSWLWFAQTKPNEALITLFTGPKRFSNSNHLSLEDHYQDMLKQFSLLGECQLNQLVSRIEACDASSKVRDPIGSNYIRVGDSNISVDPLASQGVHIAMSSALQAAVVINTIFKYPENSKLASQFYQERQIEREQNFTQKTAAAYGQVARTNSHPFWQKRAEHISIPSSEQIPDLQKLNLKRQLRLSKQSEFKRVPVLHDDHIGSHMALHHPSLKRPVAYLGDQDLYHLLKDLEVCKSGEAMLQSWSNKISSQLGTSIISWLLSRGIIEERVETCKISTCL